MSWRPHGRADVDANSPCAFAICDRCGFLYNRVKLRFQYDWRGNQVVNTNTLVCQTCYDTPYEGRRPLKLPPDPVPIMTPRPVRYAADTLQNEPLPNENDIALLYGDDSTP